MAVVLTIAGVAKQLRAGTLHIAQSANGRTTAAFDIISDDGTYRPAQDAEVIITEDGTRIFGGLVDRVSELGLFDGAPNPSIVTRVSAVDFNRYVERRVIRETFAAQSLKATLQTLVTDYLSTFGVVLHPAQVNGPTLTDLVYDDDRPMPDVLNDLSRLTAQDGAEAYVWNVDYSKQLRMFQPSTQPATFNLAHNDGNVIGDITVEKNREHYANRIILRVPQRTQANRVESFTATAGQDEFELWYSVMAHRGTVTVTDSSGTREESISEEAGSDWLLTRTITDDTQDNITRSSGLESGATVSFTFDGQLAARFVSEDAAEIAAVGYWERSVVVEDLPSLAAGQAMCDGYLAEAVNVPQAIKYQTFNRISPGQDQSVVIPLRNVNDTFIVTDVVTRDLGRDRLIRTVTANSGPVKTPNWRNVYERWLNDKTGGGAAVAVAPSPASVGQGVPMGTGSPAPPDTSNQFNDGGIFGGNAAWTFDKNSITVMIGTGHTPGGSTNLLMGEGHTVV